jgi:hypothetical protein
VLKPQVQSQTKLKTLKKNGKKKGLIVNILSEMSNTKAVDKVNGVPLTLWHETGEVFNNFDINKRSHSNGDFQVPNGIFLKPTNTRIGMTEKNIQTPLYAKIINPLILNSRQQLETYGKEN